MSEPVSEFDGAGTLQHHHAYGPGADEPILWWNATQSPVLRPLHADERGSIVAVSDSAANPIAVNRYDEYGKPAATNLGRFQYTGQMWLPEVGLYHYKNRVYAPHLGRFLQTDPIEYDGGMNLYAYVGNDPVNKVDPLGLYDDFYTPTLYRADPVMAGGNDLGTATVTGDLCRVFFCGFFGPYNRAGSEGPGRGIPQGSSETGDSSRGRAEKAKEDCHPVGKAISEGAYAFGTKLTDYSSAVIAAGLVAKSPQGVAVGEIGALLGTAIQGVAAAGRLVATGNSTRARYDAIGMAFSFFQSQTKAGSLALGYTGGKAVELRQNLTPGQDCKR